jgi:hypothetical protein
MYSKIQVKLPKTKSKRIRAASGSFSRRHPLDDLALRVSRVSCNPAAAAGDTAPGFSSLGIMFSRMPFCKSKFAPYPRLRFLFSVFLGLITR